MLKAQFSSMTLLMLLFIKGFKHGYNKTHNENYTDYCGLSGDRNLLIKLSKISHKISKSESAVTKSSYKSFLQFSKSRLMVVSHEAKEKVPCDSLSMNACEYLTRTNLVKIKNAITDGLNTLVLYYSSYQTFLVGRSYKPKLKPAGPRIALYQH